MMEFVPFLYAITQIIICFWIGISLLIANITRFLNLVNFLMPFAVLMIVFIFEFVDSMGPFDTLRLLNMRNEFLISIFHFSSVFPKGS